MLLAGACFAEEAAPLTRLDERKAAPELRLKDLDGKMQDLAHLRGKVVLVNFWATWCPPCRREMPSMQRLYQNLPKEHFEILAVNVGEDEDTVFAFTGTLDPAPTFPLLLDQDSRMLKKWPVKGLPTSFVIDKQGGMALRAVGGRDFDNAAIASQLRALIDEVR